MRHCTLNTPVRARTCPLLLNAILLSAVITISRSDKYRTEDGRCQYRGVPFSRINRSRLLELHNVCISDLIEIGRDPAFVQDDNILAAVVHLRYHEEMDLLYAGADSEVFLHSLKPFLNAQHSISLQCQTTSRAEGASGSGSMAPSAAALEYFKSFRHAQYRIALRQEVTAAYLHKRPLRYPLAAWDALDSLDEEFQQDFIWSDRSLLHCARTIEYCYGSETSSASRTEQKWLELKRYEIYWKESTAIAFQPIFESLPDRSQGRIFGQVSFLNDIHLTARQFFELSRILVLVHCPTAGSTYPSADETLELLTEEVRRTVIFLCSIAVSYPDLTPIFIQAAMAVVNGDQYFNDRLEQDALLSILLHLDRELGWPASHYVAKVEQVWARHQVHSV